MRVAALWFPDWPVQAAALEEPLAGPVAVAKNHQVEVCNAAARARGVRRGMRVRAAQAVCPQVTVLDANPERDGAMFAAIAAALDDVASSVEILRPGLVLVDLAAAGKFHGGEDTALEMLIDAASRAGVDMFPGAADEIATALIAARCRVGMVVPPGGSREFLRDQPVVALAAEVALGCDAATVAQFQRLGVRTLGELAALPRRQVATRFGQPGLLAHRIASAAPDRRVAPELPAAQLAVAVTPEEPIARVDAAAFMARQLAARLHEKLSRAGFLCVRLQVVAELEGGQRVERVWRTREALDESATADRVRWQLDGWLSQARAADGGGIVRLELTPLEVERPGVAGDLVAAARAAGAGNAGGVPAGDEEKARRVIARVQSQLGVDKVLAPRAVGGRGVAERIEFVPYGEERDAPPQGSWPGRIPAPLPARLGAGVNHPSARMQLVDRIGQPIVVTEEALLSGEPYAARWGKRAYLVSGWAGPWPVDGQWWSGGEPHGSSPICRLQLVGEEPGEAAAAGQRAWLLQWRGGQWRVEAAYF